MESNLKKYVNIIPLKDQNFDKKYVLSDFYVASSFKTFLPCTYYFDYSSIDSIEKIIKLGARFVDIDVMNKEFTSEPIVCYGNKSDNWQYTSALPFKNVISSILKTAFNEEFTNNSDPFYINFNFEIKIKNKDYSCINNCAKIIKDVLKDYLLPEKYSYQGRLSNINIATEPIQEFFKKVILVSPNNLLNTDMDELININLSHNLREKTYQNIEDVANAKELVEFNKKNFTLGIPHINSRHKDNVNFWTGYYLGCQFLCMNYTQPDMWMISYAEHFGKSSFILKPNKLQYKPIYIKKPKKKSIKESLRPLKAVRPGYEIDF